MQTKEPANASELSLLCLFVGFLRVTASGFFCRVVFLQNGPSSAAGESRLAMGRHRETRGHNAGAHRAGVPYRRTGV